MSVDVIRVGPAVALVTAEFPADGLEELGALGYEVVHTGWGVTRRALDRDALIEALARAEVFVCEVERVDAAVLDAAPALRLIGACRAEPTNVDLEAATARGVVVVRAPGRNAISVADFTVGLLLTHARRIDRAQAHLRERGWETAGDLPYFHFRGPELAGRTAGLIGLGAVGRLVAERLAAFGMAVVAYDPYLREGPRGVEMLGLDELLERSDIVSIHCPLTIETRGLIGARELARMGPSAILVNTARAAVVDEAALVAALRDRTIGGAALDVFWEEPLDEAHPILAIEGVTLTPHVAGAADDVRRHHARIILEDIIRWREGRPLRNAVSQSVGDAPVSRGSRRRAGTRS